MLDPNVLTLGFARRFAAYKRPNLLLQDPDRLAAILADEQHPVQMVIGGKAHPRDHEGQAMIRQWIRFIHDYRMEHKVVFLVDYDLLSAERLVQGVDLWINTPRRPWEACGTSGMKVLVNGGLNLSELDGWWAEAWRPQVGWALGDGKEHDADPHWDAMEAGRLYELLEREVIPLFYQRDHHGIPQGWVERMRVSMAALTPRFSTNRMVREYTERHYLPLAEAWRLRTKEGLKVAREIRQWKMELRRHWNGIHFGEVERRTVDNRHVFNVQLYLDDLPPEQVIVELYADPFRDSPAERHPMERTEALEGAVNGYLYLGVVAAQRPLDHYTVRVRPRHPHALVPLEDRHILWEL
jgi:starch phosphorylase